MRERDLSTLCIAPDASARVALEAMGRSQLGIVLVIDPAGRLIGTVTDGDVRRCVLAGVDLESSVSSLMEGRRPDLHPRPISAPRGTSPKAMLELMRTASVHHLPVVDDDGVVLGLVTFDELVSEPEFPVRGLVMAGGFGRRLSPLTDDVPKPMLTVGDGPLLEMTLDRLRAAGIHDVTISTHYLSEQIRDHFGDGGRFGVRLRYLDEETPLGTAGALRHLEASPDPVLVINGDIATNVDLRAMIAYHRDHQGVLTVATRIDTMQVPYGVLDTRGGWVRSLVEKPSLEFVVNAGIYVIDSGAIPLVPQDGRFDMTELIQKLLVAGSPVISFPVVEDWIDIGQRFDYERARDRFGSS